MADQRAEGLGSLCRLVLTVRLVSLVLTLLALPQQAGSLLPVVIAVVAGGVASYLPLRLWSRFSSTLMRHPAYLAGDLVLGMGVLALVGLDSPFFYFTLGTAALAGLLYGWTGACVFSVLLLVGYWLGLELRGAEAFSFEAAVGNPALYPLTAAAAAGGRRILDRQAATERELLAASQRTATEAERSRLARDMHDSLAKTVQGIALSASALPRWVERDPERAAQEARAVASAASEATAQARAIVTDLRAEALDTPLATAVSSYVERWSLRSGVAARTAVSDTDASSPAARFELFEVLREALDNVAQHAGASRVEVALERRDGDLVLSVADDGRGFSPGSSENGRDRGHFGILGMTERAARVGGAVEVRSIPGTGTRVLARVPGAARAADPSVVGRVTT